MEPASRPPSWRTAEQVAESARRMDEALAAGLPPELLQIMLAARRAWWLEHRGGIGAWPDVYDLGRAVGDERSRLIDELLYQGVTWRLENARENLEEAAALREMDISGWTVDNVAKPSWM